MKVLEAIEHMECCEITIRLFRPKFTAVNFEELGRRADEQFQNAVVDMVHYVEHAEGLVTNHVWNN